MKKSKVTLGLISSDSFMKKSYLTGIVTGKFVNSLLNSNICYSVDNSDTHPLEKPNSQIKFEYNGIVIGFRTETSESRSVFGKAGLVHSSDLSTWF